MHKASTEDTPKPDRKWVNIQMIRPISSLSQVCLKQLRSIFRTITSKLCQATHQTTTSLYKQLNLFKRKTQLAFTDCAARCLTHLLKNGANTGNLNRVYIYICSIDFKCSLINTCTSSGPLERFNHSSKLSAFYAKDVL